jgi:hypothetical protein
MSTLSFPCPSCRSTGAFEFQAASVEDIKTIEGATCTSCRHVVTRTELNDWVLKIATEKAQQAFSKVRR